jgi:hypothetical protein
MSVVTTQPEMLTSEPSTSNGWSLAGGSAHRSDGAGAVCALSGVDALANLVRGAAPW